MGGLASFFGGVDPGCSWQFRWRRGDASEAGGMCSEGTIERAGALCVHRRSGAVVHGARGSQADTTVTMFEVVPAEELLTARAGVFDRAEPLREVGTVFQGLELRLGAWIVIRDVWTAVGLGHVQSDQ